MPLKPMNDSSPNESLRRAMHEAKRGMVKACPRKVQRVMSGRNLSITAMSTATDVSRNWLTKLKKGEPVLRSKVDELCEQLEIPVESLLPDTPAEAAEEPWTLTPPQAWEIVEYLGPFLQAPNGLSYRTTQLRHSLVREKRGRGKFYDLLHVNPQDRDEFKEHLTRHPQVCELIGDHPNIAENLDVRPLPDKSGWWVIDRWMDGTSLEKLVGDRLFDPRAESVRAIGEGVLGGLSAMHQAGIIFRELSPDKVWISSEEQRVILTDFELAKLTGGAPSVSEQWDYGYFRAPEIGEHDAFAQSDLYSWGRLIVWLLAGGKTKQRSLPDDSKLPQKVQEIVQKCMQPRPSKRPPSADAVLAVWRKWK